MRGREVGLMGTAVAGMIVFSWVAGEAADRILLRQEAAWARSLTSAFQPLYDRARRAHDDLLICDLTAALSHAPGVHRVTADLSGSQRLRLDLSPTLRRRLIVQVYGMSAITGSVLALVWGGLGVVFLREGAKHRRSREEQRALLLDEQRASQRSRERAALLERQLHDLWREALRWVDHPLVLLNDRQRIVGLTRSAGARLAIDPDAVVGRSWMDVASLRDAAPAMERALAHPGQEERVAREGSAPSLRLRTLGVAEGSTWVGISVE